MHGRRTLADSGPVGALTAIRAAIRSRLSAWPLRFIVALLVGVAAAGNVAADGRMTLPIIVYHRIAVPGVDEGPPGPDQVALDRFAAQMRHLVEQGYRTLSMDEVVAFLEGKALGDKVVAIHFDDGWRSVLAALPVLERYGHKATFWIIAGSGTRAPHLDWDEIVALDRNPLFEVQSHSLTHPAPPRQQTMVDWVEGRAPGKGVRDAKAELVESKRLLEEKLGRPVPYFAWAGGHYNDALVELAREAGYRALVTAREGINAAGGDPYRIRRTMIDGSCGEEAFFAILRDGLLRHCSGRPSEDRY